MKRFFATRTPRVFWGSTLAVVVFVALAAADGAVLEAGFQAVRDWAVRNLAWFLILVVNAMLVLSVFLMVGRYGRLRLGRDDERPEFGRAAWLSMLFSAGMGIGLVFWSVAEPVMHFNNPPLGEARTPEAAREAIVYTFYHWGLHAWAIYCITGLSLGYFSFRHGLPLTIRSAFVPLLGRKIRGWFGDVIDTVAVLATLFGLATSLGLGAMQIAAGLEYLGWATPGKQLEVGIIAAITAVAIVSVVLGLRTGIRRLSELNMVLALLLMVFVFFLGPTLMLIGGLQQNIGMYLNQLLRLSTWTDTYSHTGWQEGWTAFYWAWWIAWSPFVGMFFAMISRGRTIREYVAGVLLVPAGMTFIWLTVFGTSALELEMSGRTAVSDAMGDGVAMALFAFLHQFPWAKLSSGVALIVLALFFVTSSDSGSLVVDSLASGGLDPAPVAQRVYWAGLEGVIAAFLLLTGGLTALQAGSIVTGLPFALVLIFMAVGLMRVLRRDQERLRHGRSP